MSSLFDAPSHLMMVLAAVVAGHEPAEHAAIWPVRAAVGEQGPYAFSETNWLAAIRQGFGGAPLEPWRVRIFATSNGRLYVPVAAEKNDILALRQNDGQARAAAIGLAKFNFVSLRTRLGREPNIKDLYAAHMLGLDLAAQMAGLKADRPGAIAATALPELAVRYRETAFSKGVALTIADVYRLLPDAAPSDITRIASRHLPAALRGAINDHVPDEETVEEAWLPAHVALQSMPDVSSAPVSP